MSDDGVQHTPQLSVFSLPCVISYYTEDPRIPVRFVWALRRLQINLPKLSLYLSITHVDKWPTVKQYLAANPSVASARVIEKDWPDPWLGWESKWMRRV